MTHTGQWRGDPDSLSDRLLGEIVYQTMHHWPDVLPESEVLGVNGLAGDDGFPDTDYRTLTRVRSSRMMIYLVLRERYGLGEFRQLCLDLDIDYDRLEGEDLSIKQLDLVLHMDGRDRLEELSLCIMSVHPDIVDLETDSLARIESQSYGGALRQILERHYSNSKFRGLWGIVVERWGDSP